ncbi:CPXV119 protein [Cowpox virus]|uniref:CPXV119 protein n=1 Tax=Cowpox virus TaxID=10243 RepID=A0A290GA63_COWPX|nr:CPXV119 protein [Cowpox virus]ATB55598.1 CPXV119 protein [Cowpox virus]ATB56027.1 CPXV119 protein [Cowpox virus]
MSINIDIKK